MSGTDVSRLEYEGKEIRIEVPWGFIAAKEYGACNGIPVIAIHGWLDNCGSFDPLMPYILTENNLHVVSFDEPGCGLSSHKPVGADYGAAEVWKEIKRVMEFMRWNSVTLLGHSRGAMICLLFAAIYPELVERVILIDEVKVKTLNKETMVQEISKAIEQHLCFENKFMDAEKAKPVFTKEEALNKIIQSRSMLLSESNAKILMKRSCKECENGVVFTHDHRQKFGGIRFLPTNEVMLQLLNNVRCDLLVVITKRKDDDEAKEVQEYLNLYKKNCKIFRYVAMDGTHYMHMNDAHLVGPLINTFIRDSLDIRSTGGIK